MGFLQLSIGSTLNVVCDLNSFVAPLQPQKRRTMALKVNKKKVSLKLMMRRRKRNGGFSASHCSCADEISHRHRLLISLHRPPLPWDFFFSVDWPEQCDLLFLSLFWVDDELQKMKKKKNVIISPAGGMPWPGKETFCCVIREWRHASCDTTTFLRN